MSVLRRVLLGLVILQTVTEIAVSQGYQDRTTTPSPPVEVLSCCVTQDSSSGTVRGGCNIVNVPRDWGQTYDTEYGREVRRDPCTFWLFPDQEHDYNLLRGMTNDTTPDTDETGRKRFFRGHMPEDEDEYGSSYSFPYNGRYRTARICSFDAYDLPPLTPYHSFRVHIYPGHKVVGNIPVSSSCSLDCGEDMIGCDTYKCFYKDRTCDYWHNCEDGKDESQEVCHWWCVLDHKGNTCTAMLVSAGSFVVLVILRVLLCKVRPSKKRGKWMEKRKSSDDATVNDKFEIVALWIRSFCYYICCCCCKLRVPSREKGKLLEVREIPDDPADDKFEAARRFASKNWLEIVGLWFKFCLYYIFCCCVGRSKKPSLPQDNPYTVLNESVYSVTAPEPCDMARSGQDIKPENPEVKETAKDESDLANRLLQYVENV